MNTTEKEMMMESPDLATETPIPQTGSENDQTDPSSQTTKPEEAENTASAQTDSDLKVPDQERVNRRPSRNRSGGSVSGSNILTIGCPDGDRKGQRQVSGSGRVHENRAVSDRPDSGR